jgi:hypothetical protein
MYSAERAWLTGANKWTLTSGPMAEQLTHSTSKMTDEDVSPRRCRLRLDRPQPDQQRPHTLTSINARRDAILDSVLR